MQKSLFQSATNFSAFVKIKPKWKIKCKETSTRLTVCSLQWKWKIFVELNKLKRKNLETMYSFSSQRSQSTHSSVLIIVDNLKRMFGLEKGIFPLQLFNCILKLFIETKNTCRTIFEICTMLYFINQWLKPSRTELSPSKRLSQYSF